jgi:Calcineurin-like phosphoesterase
MKTIVCIMAIASLPLARTTPAVAQAMAERNGLPVHVTGSVFLDGNGNGTRDAGEAGVAGVPVSDQVTIVTTDAEGRFAIDAAGYGYVFVEQPDGFAVRGPFWRSAQAETPLSIGLVSAQVVREFTFIHASDTHISEQNVDRFRRFRAIVDSVRPAFVLITGDLLRDALRVPEAEARGYFELLEHELAAFTVPVYTVPGNHENFGIERQQSLVSRTHPMYGKRMFRSFLGPNYFAFDFGGIHFVGLDSVDYDDTRYYGHVDSLQLAWLEREVARLPAGRPVVTFNHIPMITAGNLVYGVEEDGVAPTLIRVGGTTYYRHIVNNTSDVLAILGSRLDIALGGHMHLREQLRFETNHGTKRFFQTAAVTGPAFGDGQVGVRSGVTLYRVSAGHVDDGTFIPLDPDPSPRTTPARASRTQTSRSTVDARTGHPSDRRLFPQGRSR